MNEVRVRSRLDPEVRRGLMLDVAAKLVSDEGVSAVTMERVSEQAGVSKALGYTYFKNKTNLLAELLIREYPAFQDETPTPVDYERSFEDIITVTTKNYLDHVAEKGILLQRLLNEPSVSSAVAQRHSVGREVTAQYFGAQLASAYDIPIERAIEVATILMGVTAAAGKILFEGDRDRETIIELTTAIIMACVRETERQERSRSDFN